MLGKLIKHDLKSTARVIPFLFLAVILMGAVAAVGILLELPVMEGTGWILMVLSSVAAVIVTFVLVIRHFYKNLYGREGYLTFTLPVSTGRILASKFIVGTMWLVLSYLVGIGSLIGCFVIAAGDSLWALGIGFNAAMTAAGLSVGHLILLLATLVISSIYSLSLILFSLTLANISPFGKHPVGFAFLIYFVVSIFMSIAGSFVLTLLPLSVSFTQNGMVWINGQGIGSLISPMGSLHIPVTNTIFEIIIAIALIVVTNVIMKKRVSIR